MLEEWSDLNVQEIGSQRTGCTALHEGGVFRKKCLRAK